MKKQNSILTTLPVLFGFFVMGFCDIVGISSDYVQRSFNWSPVMTGFVPSMVFIWFLFLSIPIGNQMNKTIGCTLRIPKSTGRVVNIEFCFFIFTVIYIKHIIF